MHNVDIALIRPNGKSIMYAGISQGATAVDPPYWLAVMGGWLRDRGYRVALIDAEAAGDTPQDTARRIADMKPKLIGVFTLGSNLTASTWTMPGARLCCNAIKETTPDIPMFLWGNHPSALPECTLREESVDYVIVGEGFDAVEKLLRYLTGGSPKRDRITGVTYLENDKFCGINETSIIADLNELPVDGWDLLPEDQRHYRNHMHFAFENLSERDRYGAILAGLGCPYNCSYCAIRCFSGNTRGMRYKTVENALREIDWWAENRNVYYLRILDECFTINRKFAMQFCKELTGRKYNLSIWINARIDTVDEELLLCMRTAGIKWIGYGIESCSNRLRGIVNKEQYDYEKTKRIIELTKSCGIFICGNVMFGLPGEYKEDMEADLVMLRELNIEYPNMYCTMAYPGSELYKQVLAEHPERLPETWAGYAQLAYETKPLATDNLTAEEILAYRDYAFSAFFDDNKRYFDMLQTKFGQSAVDAVNVVLESGKLKRQILGD